MRDISQDIQQQIENAVNKKQALKIQSASSKSFYGNKVNGDILDISQHQGVISYEPTELVITARAGTPLKDIESTLKDQGQMLGFEPAGYTEAATLGGTIACNISGPRRAYQGAARDYVLGCHIINGKAETLHFGGEVMKNVAGYDVSRLICGAQGTLGAILDVSLKVIPLPEAEITLVFDCDIATALHNMHLWMQQAQPLSASCYDGKQLFIRLSSNEASIKSAHKIMGGEILQNPHHFWQQIKEQQHTFFKTNKPLWRLSLASNTRKLNLDGDTLYEWGGALRWLVSDEPQQKIREALTQLNGHATCYKNATTETDIHHPLSSDIFFIHKQLKTAFDPENIMNPGRLYTNL